jgi:hypothetical protein
MLALARLVISLAVPTFAQQKDTDRQIVQQRDLTGCFSGRRDIGKTYADTFQRSPITDFNSRRERRHLNTLDNAVWSAGQWAATLQSESDRCPARAV